MRSASSHDTAYMSSPLYGSACTQYLHWDIMCLHLCMYLPPLVSCTPPAVRMGKCAMLNNNNNHNHNNNHQNHNSNAVQLMTR